MKTRVRQAAGSRGGFTLIELLVVVAIIAVLIALLIPSLALAKRQAKRQTCAARIRSLIQASLAYKTELGKYPDALSNYMYGGRIYPSDVQSRMINQLGPYLNIRTTIREDMSPRIKDIPLVFQCQFIAEWAEANNQGGANQGAGPWDNCRYPASGGTMPYWQVGFMYYYGLDKAGNPGQVQPAGVGRFVPYADVNARADAVLWADGVGVYGPSTWWYTHIRGSVLDDGSFSFFHTSLKSFDGANIGTVDGAVRWRDAKTFKIDEYNPNGSNPCYKGDGSWLYWF